jgi:hypothetical protein
LKIAKELGIQLIHQLLPERFFRLNNNEAELMDYLARLNAFLSEAYVWVGQRECYYRAFLSFNLGDYSPNPNTRAILDSFAVSFAGATAGTWKGRRNCITNYYFNKVQTILQSNRIEDPSTLLAIYKVLNCEYLRVCDWTNAYDTAKKMNDIAQKIGDDASRELGLLAKALVGILSDEELKKTVRFVQRANLSAK